MPSSPQSLINTESRHAVYVNRFSGGLHNDFLPFLEDLQKDLEFRIRQENTDFQGTRLATLLKDTREIQQEIYADYQGELFGSLEEFSSHEAGFEQKALSSVADVDFTLPGDTQVWASVNSNMIALEQTGQAQLLNPLIKDWTKSEILNVEKAIRFGFVQGQTVDEMVKAISGKDGILDKRTRSSNRSIVRTSVNHTSTIARQETMKDNDDIVIGYTIVATLDNRTTNVCKGYDGVQVKWTDTKQPKAPFHIGCRTTDTALFDERFNFDKSNDKRGSVGADERGQVPANQSYYEWLKSQSNEPNGKAFVQDILGKERADLFLNGGLSVERFKKLTTDEQFRPIPLKELKKKDSLSMAFDKIEN